MTIFSHQIPSASCLKAVIEENKTVFDHENQLWALNFNEIFFSFHSSGFVSNLIMKLNLKVFRTTYNYDLSQNWSNPAAKKAIMALKLLLTFTRMCFRLQVSSRRKKKWKSSHKYCFILNGKEFWFRDILHNEYISGESFSLTFKLFS